MQQFLQGTTVVQTAAYFGHKLFGNVKGKPAPLQATVEDVAGVLFPRKTGAAVFAHTGAASQAQGAERGGPEGVSLQSKPSVGHQQGIRI